MADSGEIPETRLSQAVQHRNRGEYQQAIQLLKSLISQQPENAEAFHQLGLVHSFLVNEEESITALTKAIELEPDNVLYLVDLGKTYAMYGDYEKAISIFERVQELGG